MAVLAVEPPSVCQVWETWSPHWGCGNDLLTRSAQLRFV